MIEKTTWFQLQPLYKHIRQQAENKKSFKYIEIGATFFLIAIFLFTAIAPTAKAISNLVGEIKSKQILEKKLKAKINSIILAQNNYSSMQEDSIYKILEASFPSRPRYYQSAIVFSANAKESNTSINQLTFDVIKKDTLDQLDQKKTFGVSTSNQGEYLSFLSLLNKITNSRRLIDIESINLSQQDKKEASSSGSGAINLNLSTNLFYLPTLSNEQK